MARSRKNNFSIIIPTYTGEEHIDECFKSILEQDSPQYDYEIVVIVDGPNKSLRKKVDDAATTFKLQGIDFTVHQFAKNRGRFYARYKGAEIARHDQLLFVDDRVTLDRRFMREVAAAGTDLLMSNVLETSQPHMLSRLNYLLRRKVYGKKMWGTSFKSYQIKEENFEKAPKGTAGFWVPRDTFLNACHQVEAEVSKGDSLRHSSDDTKILREIVSGKRILKSSTAIIYYNPRAKFVEEAHHIYQRGPKFVDYYMKNGSRFQPYLMASMVGMAIVVAGIILWRWVFVLGIASVSIGALIFLSLVLMEKPRDVLVVWVTLPFVAVLFGAGIAKGMAAKAYRGLVHRYN